MTETQRPSRRLPQSDDRFFAGDLVSAHAIPLSGRLPVLSAMLGAMVGIVGVAFFTISELLRSYLFGSVAGIQHGAESVGGDWYGRLAAMLPAPDPSNPKVWLLALIPFAGGLLLGLWYKLTRDTSHAGTEVAIRSFHHEHARFQKGNLWKKFVASCITLGTGGAAGREGPIALMGASMGSTIASKLGLTQRERRILLVAGLAAGIGGMFRAPLAGGLMAAELLYSDAEFEPDVLIPSTIASIISYCVFCLNFGWGSLFGRVATDYQFRNPLELLPLAALAVAVAGAGWLFVRANRIAEKLLARVPRIVRPAVGAGAAGIVAIILYLVAGQFTDSGDTAATLFAVMGDGYAALKLGLGGQGLWWIFLMVAGGKILAASLTVASGGAGGYFAPSMVIGGTVGAAIGLLFYQWFPDVLLPSGQASAASVTAVFALVGMAAFWTGVAKVPVGSVIIVSELTGSYHLLLPAMWTCVIVFVLSRRFQIFRTQVASRRQSPAHVGDFAVDVLREMKVAELLPELVGHETVEEGTSLQQILAMKSSRQAYYPVVSRDGHFKGIFSLNDVRAVLDSSEVWQLLVAADIARQKVRTVKPSKSLADVAAMFAETDYDELPVVAEEDESRLLGMISRRQLNNAYIKRVMHYDSAARSENAPIGSSVRAPKVLPPTPPEQKARP